MLTFFNGIALPLVLSFMYATAAVVRFRVAREQPILWNTYRYTVALAVFYSAVYLLLAYKHGYQGTNVTYFIRLSSGLTAYFVWIKEPHYWSDVNRKRQIALAGVKEIVNTPVIPPTSGSTDSGS